MSQKYAAYDSTGSIIAFYDSVDSPVPQGVTVVKITDADWQLCIDAVDNPYKVVGGTLTPPAAKTAAEILADAKSVQKSIIDSAYADAVTANVTFNTSSGVTREFQADSGSQTVVMQATQGYMIAGETPSGFYWVSADNTRVPFTLADLQGLYQTILAQGWAAFQRRQDLKAQIEAAETAAAVQAITWT